MTRENLCSSPYLSPHKSPRSHATMHCTLLAWGMLPSHLHLANFCRPFNTRLGQHFAQVLGRFHNFENWEHPFAYYLGRSCPCQPSARYLQGQGLCPLHICSRCLAPWLTVNGHSVHADCLCWAGIPDI